MFSSDATEDVFLSKKVGESEATWSDYTFCLRTGLSATMQLLECSVRTMSQFARRRDLLVQTAGRDSWKDLLGEFITRVY